MMILMNNRIPSSLKLAEARMEIYITFVDGCTLSLDKFESIVADLWSTEAVGKAGKSPYVLPARHYTGKATFKLECFKTRPVIAEIEEQLDGFLERLYKYFYECRLNIQMRFAFYTEDGRVFPGLVLENNFEDEDEE